MGESLFTIHRFWIILQNFFYGRTTKYNATNTQVQRDVGIVLFPKIAKTVHFRGTFEWNKSLINVAKCYADCITKCVAAYGIVCSTHIQCMKRIQTNA